MTNFSDIIDLALVNITDYRLSNRYTEDPAKFMTYMTGFLLKGKPEFYNCLKNLSLINDDKTAFVEDLNDDEKNILADLTVLQWYKKEINNPLQYNGLLNDKDFKRYSEANNLQAKSHWFAVLREEIYQKMVDYSIKYGAYLNGDKKNGSN